MQRRRGFTITELLVAMALIMFIMAILSEAFVVGLTTFTQLKSVGDMDAKMRAAVTILARDLSDEHFGGPNTGAANNYTRLSALTLPLSLANQSAYQNPIAGPVLPYQGYFYVQSPASTPEGVDPDSIPSYRSGGACTLSFTVNRGYSWNNSININFDRRENYFVGYASGTSLPALSRFSDGSNYLSQVAEVSYFLTANGNMTTTGLNGDTPLTLYTLYRRQAVVLNGGSPIGQDATTINASTTGNYGTYYDFSWSPSTKAFNTLSTLVNPANRMLGASPTTFSALQSQSPAPPSTLIGSDLLLTDVISFDVQLFMANGTDFVDPPGGSYDTATATTNVLAIQIIIRVWDFKTQQARQITVVQNM